MPIESGDIKLVASQVMNDVPEGGGAPTAVEIVDGNSNTIFNDISELDRAGGRVNLRKLFASVQTATTEGYFGANVIVAEPPQDPRVSVTLFSTESTFDRRDDARDRLEAYLAPGGEFAGFLFENHIRGMRSIQLFQRTTDIPPTIGSTLLLVQNEGLSTEKAQYVRVTRVSVVQRTFTIPNTTTDYQANITTCDISDPLREDFTGSGPNREFRRSSNSAMTRDTVVADAATYYGVVPLSEAVNLGSLSAKVTNIFTQLVPSAQTEIPIIDANAAGELNAPVDSASGTVSFTTGIGLSASSVLYIGTPIYPGSLSIAYSGGTLTDNGGDLYNGAVIVGTVDYENGEVRFGATSPSFGGTKTVTYRPTVFPLAVADTLAISVTAATRAYNYSRFITPIPAPGTLRVSYRAQGRWYTLRDNGAGILSGSDAAYGSGTISYSTGNAAVTLGALPDAGSSILFFFGSSAVYFNRSGLTPQRPRYGIALTNDDIVRGTVTVTWNDGTARTATESGGVFSGDATGTIDYATGELQIAPNNLVAAGQQFTVTYDHGPPTTQSFTFPWNPSGLGTNAVSLQLSQSPISPGTVDITFFVRTAYNYAQPSIPGRQARVYDNGTGGIVLASSGAVVGSINYTTGLIQFNTEVTVNVLRYVWKYQPFGLGAATPYVSQLQELPFTLNAKTGSLSAGEEPYQPIVVRYRLVAGAAQSDIRVAPSTVAIDLTPGFAEPVVPGSINFTLAGRRYFDRLGRLFYDLDPATGAATEAGTINYTSGEVTITSWVAGQSSAVALSSLLTSLEQRPVTAVAFRIPASPVRPGSFQLIGTFADSGTSINATAETDGDVVGAGITGTIDYETGVVLVRFGDMVTAAGNESQSWYDPAAVTGGMIFRPKAVLGSTLRFNAVAFSYLPLDADILGLDPVRLPQDGRVPIFRPGSFAVIGHTGTVGPVTVTNGQTINCARVRLSRVRVIDSTGAVKNTGYTTDLEAGTVTFTNVSGMVQPVTVEHRIEDMMLVSDAQISGDLTFTRQITHNYPLGSYVSSAMVAGDLSARVSLVFDQATWNGSWSDTLAGSAATASFNSALYPITVTNAGAVTERWIVRFTNTTQFEVIGENVGIIAAGNLTSVCAPLNPATGQPYFTIPVAGWGSGWGTGNVLRFNTVGANFPLWVARTIQQGPETVTDDSFTLLIRGDIDRP
jgi:hypothetical protein